MLFSVPLPTPPATLYDRVGVGPEASDDEVGWAVATTETSLRKQERRLRQQPGERAAEEATAVTAARQELTEAKLDKPGSRHEYDLQHPPLDLLKLQECASAGLLDSRTWLHLLRAELTRFLTDAGASVFHPSDLTRSDFSEDFTFDELLDGR